MHIILPYKWRCQCNYKRAGCICWSVPLYSISCPYHRIKLFLSSVFLRKINSIYPSLPQRLAHHQLFLNMPSKIGTGRLTSTTFTWATLIKSAQSVCLTYKIFDSTPSHMYKKSYLSFCIKARWKVIPEAWKAGDLAIQLPIKWEGR